MRLRLLSAVAFLICSSFLSDRNFKITSALSTEGKKNIFDFSIHRLSNERVFISWHTSGDTREVIYEVMRRHSKREMFISLGIVNPVSIENNTADYSFTDINNFSDSSFYCLKKTNEDSVIFYSITKGIEGIAKEQ